MDIIDAEVILECWFLSFIIVSADISLIETFSIGTSTVWFWRSKCVEDKVG